MIAILSPSKTMDFESAPPTKEYSQPKHLSETKKLAQEMKKHSAKEIAKMMKVSDKIADLNYQRFQKFSTPFSLKNAKQAIFAFQGDVYRYIDSENYNQSEFEFAQDHLRILSGFYGLLKPLDLIQPYRLEMKYRTDFWQTDDKLTKSMNKDLEKEGSGLLVNLASNEYSKPLDFKKLNAKILNIKFQEKRDGKLKTIAIYSKLARGTMANYIVKNKITTAEKLKNFNLDNYQFSDKDSNEREFTFVR